MITAEITTELLDAAIDHTLRQLRSEHDAAKIEKLANAAQSLFYSKWQYLQPYGTATGSMALLSSAALDTPKRDPLV